MNLGKTIKYYTKELIKVLSSEDSFFSKKRLESFVAFIVVQMGLVVWFFRHVDGMVASDLFIWASIELLICGYNIYQLQKEKNVE